VIVSIQPGTNPIISFVLSPLGRQRADQRDPGSFAVTVAPVADTLAIGGTAAVDRHYHWTPMGRPWRNPSYGRSSTPASPR